MDIKRHWSVPIGWDTERPNTTRSFSMPIEWEVEWFHTKENQGYQIDRPNSAPPLERSDKSKVTKVIDTTMTLKGCGNVFSSSSSSSSRPHRLSKIIASPSTLASNDATSPSKKAHRGKRGRRCKENEKVISCDANRQPMISKTILKRPVPLSGDLVVKQRRNPVHTVASIMPKLERPSDLSDKRDTECVRSVREALTTYELDVPNTQSYTVIEHSFANVNNKRGENNESRSLANELAKHAKIKAVLQEHEIRCTNIKSILKSWPPDLPKIPDEAIELQVFTAPCVLTQIHMLDISDSLKSSGANVKHNKVLEFIGRKILDTIVTSALHDWYPEYTVNQLEVMRRELVSSKYIIAFSKLYNFGDRVLRSRNSTPQQGLEEAFRAYVGGLFTTCGWEPVNSWIQQLLKPLTEDASRQCLEVSEDKKYLQKQKQIGKKGKTADRNVCEQHFKDARVQEVGNDWWYNRLIHRVSLGYLHGSALEKE